MDPAKAEAPEGAKRITEAVVGDFDMTPFMSISERIKQWQDRRAVCDVFDKGYTEKRTEADTAIFDAAEILRDAAAELERNMPEDIERAQAARTPTTKGKVPLTGAEPVPRPHEFDPTGRAPQSGKKPARCCPGRPPGHTGECSAVPIRGETDKGSD